MTNDTQPDATDHNPAALYAAERAAFLAMHRAWMDRYRNHAEFLQARDCLLALADAMGLTIEQVAADLGSAKWVEVLS